MGVEWLLGHGLLRVEWLLGHGTLGVEGQLEHGALRVGGQLGHGVLGVEGQLGHWLLGLKLLHRRLGLQLLHGGELNGLAASDQVPHSRIQVTHVIVFCTQQGQECRGSSSSSASEG